MANPLNLQPTTVTISNRFDGPNFVNGLAIQSASYTVVSPTRARLEFQGGFNPAITYVQIVEGTGFGIDADGRYTGTVTGYVGFEKGAAENRWRFDDLDTGLDRLNTLAADPDVTFQDLLLIPLVYRFVGAGFDDVFITGSFDDVARGFAGDDNFDGLTGDDVLIGGDGDDLLTGGGDDDRLNGGADEDALFGGDGEDLLFGGEGEDRLFGGDGSDIVRGGADRDRLRGGDGSDTLYGGGGGDRIAGGAGSDIGYGGGGADAMSGEAGGDTLEGGDGDDRIDGGEGTNFLFGERGSDGLVSGSGSDQLFGGGGADRLAAGGGADFVVGGFGDDRLSANAPGGAGDDAVDTFIFEGAFGRDVVTDFEVGLDGILFAVGIGPGDVTTRAFGDNVRVDVDLLEGQSIVLRGVADSFDPAIDISFA
jgi:Ca2+-binding RTX toxin-like protein